MRKIIITTFVTLDGVMQAPGAPHEDPSKGFKWGGWIAASGFDDKMNEIMGGIIGSPFDLLLGRRTYEIFAAYWPYIGNEDPFAAKFNAVHKYVAAHRPLASKWDNTSVIDGDVVAGLRELKKTEGSDLVVYGSGELIQTLLANQLADKLYVWTFPLTVGKGKRLFEGGSQPGTWKLTDSLVATTGTIVAQYEPAGELVPGTVGSETTPSEAELARRKRWEEAEG
jgi:dihydrofolate reductase